MSAWEEMATHLRALAPEVSVYSTLTEQLDVPCYAVVPGEPWIDPQGTHPSFGHDEERYDVWAIASSGFGWASVPLLHAMVHALRHNLPDGWFFETVGQTTQIDHNGATYFGAPVRLTYNNCEPGGDTSS